MEKSVILIIFGVSGDLAKRYLLPAIGKIAEAGKMPKEFHIFGITRQSDANIDELLKNTSDAEYLRDYFSLYRMDVADIEEYKKLDKYLKQIEKNFSAPAERLFYLSVPPQVSKSIVELLGKSGLSKIGEPKLLLEKPFGVSLEDAKDLTEHIDRYFSSEQVYRVDHYMAKETAQNIIVFRSGNSLFKKTWNKDFIESIEIIASEEIDIEGRANFYEQTGAMKDYVQSHLLQLLALTLMELPQNSAEVPILREKALKNLNIVCDVGEKECVKRGQYAGYREEVKNEKSMVETFVSINVASSDKNWKGVRLTLTTGKALNERLTAIKIRYKKDKENESNELLLRLQPDAGIEFSIWTKIPGYEHKLSRQTLHFIFKEKYKELPEAYEQVLFNAINSDHSLFTANGEILETWRILDVLSKSWAKNNDNLIIYKKGSTIEEVMI